MESRKKGKRKRQKGKTHAWRIGFSREDQGERGEDVRQKEKEEENGEAGMRENASRPVLFRILRICASQVIANTNSH